MHKEVAIPHENLEILAHELANVFVQRRDLYARQLDDGRYVCVRKPLLDRHLVAHLKGDLTLGTYVLDQSNRTKYIVIDADEDWIMERLFQMADVLASQNIPSYLEASRRGGHLWLIFENSLTGRAAREFGKGLLSTFDLSGVELFPKQSQLKTGPGSLIRLPFGIHRRTGLRYGFLNLEGKRLASTLAEQINVLGAPRTVPKAALDAYRQQVSQSPQRTEFTPPETSEGVLSKRIKDSITVLDFVSRYVDLSYAGIGLCPFHDDHHPSFAVNAKSNYWHCFSGCGGGSIIDFWMKWHDCDFKSAIHELADILL